MRNQHADSGLHLLVLVFCLRCKFRGRFGISKRVNQVQIHTVSGAVIKHDPIKLGVSRLSEVIGTIGQLPKGSIDLIESIDDVKKYENDKNNLAYVTQTTLSVDDTRDIIKSLKEKFPNIREPQKEDICYATTNRQSAVKNIAKLCEMFFVIGSRNSSNSVRLVEVAKNSGCEKSTLIHSESVAPFEEIDKCSTIGISSGASAPEVLVDNFISSLREKYEIEIEEVEIIKEDIVFKVPNKLN
mgnify:CR=1 FL=1